MMLLADNNFVVLQTDKLGSVIYIIKRRNNDNTVTIFHTSDRKIDDLHYKTKTYSFIFNY